ncbi:MAG TPA: fibronectin type III domain-containing protein [Steroidobacteraceae bacterium]
MLPRSVTYLACALCLGGGLLGTACRSTLGEAQLAWQPPQAQDSGKPAAPVAGYRIAWGLSAGGPFDLGEQRVSAATTSYTVRNLRAGNYCFVVYSRSDAGVESPATPAVCKQIK